MAEVDLGSDVILIYKGKHVKLEDLPEGRYAVRSQAHDNLMFPIVNRDDLLERIRELGYEGEVVVRGPFEYMHLVIGGGDER